MPVDSPESLTPAGVKQATLAAIGKRREAVEQGGQNMQMAWRVGYAEALRDVLDLLDIPFTTDEVPLP